MRPSLPLQKRAFDLILLAAVSVFVIPAIAFCMLAIYISDGRPIFYKSRRRVAGAQSLLMAKFRTMRRDAEKVANRTTVPIVGTRFLNIPIDSPLYTPVGRWIERLMLTETPQLVYVVQGKMSLVGNRPLPENVIAALKEVHPSVEARFGMPAGLTGPVQLVGREEISDGDRLRVEAAYCTRVGDAYDMLLDLKILLYTVYVGLYPERRFTVEQVLQLVAARSVRRESVATFVGSLGRRRAL